MAALAADSPWDVVAAVDLHERSVDAKEVVVEGTWHRRLPVHCQEARLPLPGCTRTNVDNTPCQDEADLHYPEGLGDLPDLVLFPALFAAFPKREYQGRMGPAVALLILQF